MLLLFIYIATSYTNWNISSTGVLTGCSSNETVITIPSNVVNITGKPFSGLNATSLTFATGLVIQYAEPGFLDESIFSSVRLPLLNGQPGQFANLIYLVSLELTLPWDSIPSEAFAGCLILTSLKIEQNTLLFRQTLTFPSRIWRCGSHAFRDVVFRYLTLPLEFEDPWNFDFAGHYFLESIDVKQPLTALRSDMFADCPRLRTILHDDESLLNYGQLTLIGIRPTFEFLINVFTGVYVHTVELDLVNQFNPIFFANFTTVTSLIYHTVFPQDNFSLPISASWFPNVTHISIGPYDIMIESSVDLSHTPINSFAVAAFRATKITSIFFSKSGAQLAPYCFESCSLLTSVVIPDSISTIPESTFKNCVGLRSLVISGYELIENETLNLYNTPLRNFKAECFSGVPFRRILFGSTMTLGDKSFAYNNFLYEIMIVYVGASIKLETPTSAPFRHTNLNYILIPKGVFCSDLTSFSSYFFLDTPIQTVPDWAHATSCLIQTGQHNVTIDGFQLHPYNQYRLNMVLLNEETITIPDSIKYISMNAFSQVSLGRTLIFGSDLEQVDDFAFRGSKFETIIFPEGYTELNYGLFSSISTIKNVTFLGDVKAISAYCFYQATGLTTIQINDTTILDNNVLDLEGLLSVGRDAFRGTHFTVLKIPESIESHGNIGVSSDVESVEIFGRLSSFPAYVFQGSVNLKSIKVNDQLILNNSVLNVSSFSNLNIGPNAFSRVPINMLVFNRTAIFHSIAFESCDSLTDVIFTSSIPARFAVPPQIRGLSTLSNLIMDDIPIIQNGIANFSSSFYNFDAFAELPITEAYVSRPGVAMFDQCEFLQIVNFSSFFFEIPDDTFRMCLRITSISGILQDGIFSSGNLTRIGENAFVRCGITTINFNCVSLSVGDYAFASNFNLIYVNFLDLNNNGFSIDEGAQIFAYDNQIQNVTMTGIRFCEEIDILFEEIFSGSNLEGKTWSEFGCIDDYYFLTFHPSNNSILIGCNSTSFEVRLPAHIRELAPGCFADSNSSELFFVRDSQLSLIQPGAFEGSQFTKISLPPSLVTIPVGFYSSNYYIKHIIFEGNLANFSESSFNGSYNLELIEINGRIALQNQNLNLFVNSGKGAFFRVRITSVVLGVPVSMTFEAFGNLQSVVLYEFSIPNRMFAQCYSLSTMYIRFNVILQNRILNLTSIYNLGSQAFVGVSISQIIMTKVTAYQFDSFDLISGTIAFNLTGQFDLDELRTLIQTGRTTKIDLNSNTILNQLMVDFSTIPVSSIPEGEFANTNYRNVTLPKTLSSLSRSLFQNSPLLQYVNIPTSLPISFYPDYIFQNCYNLISIQMAGNQILLNGSLTLTDIYEIGESAFANTTLNYLTIPNLITLSNYSFGNTSIATIEFTYVSVNFIGYPFRDCYSINSLYLPENITCASLNGINENNLFRYSSLQGKSWTYFGCIVSTSTVRPTVSISAITTTSSSSSSGSQTAPRSSSSVDDGSDSVFYYPNNTVIIVLGILLGFAVVSIFVFLFAYFRRMWCFGRDRLTNENNERMMYQDLLET